MVRYLVLVALLGLTACGIDNRPAAERADEAFAQGHYLDARIHLANAIDANPESVEMQLLLGRTAIAQGDGQMARMALERAAVLAPDRSDEIAPMLAHALLLAGESEEALALLDDEDEGDPYRIRIRAQALLLNGDTGQSWQTIEAGLAASPEDADLLALAGQYRLSSGNLSDAETYAARSLESPEPSVESYLLAGRIASIRGDLETAINHYNAATEDFPDHVGAYIALAAIHADRDETNAMDRAMARIERISPGHPAAIFIAAKDALNRGDLGRARELGQGFASGARNNPPLALFLGELEIRLGNREQGIRWLREYRRHDPYHSKASFLLAHALIDSGQTNDAYAVIAQPASRATASRQSIALAAHLARQLGEDDADRLARRAAMPDLAEAADTLREAQTAMAGNDWEAAATAYGRLIANGYENHALVLNNAALASFRSEQNEIALNFAERAYELVADDPSVLDTLGWIRLETGGDRTEALVMLRRAAQLDPGNAQIRWHLAQVLAVNGQRSEARTIAASLLPLVSEAQRERIEAFQDTMG